MWENERKKKQKFCALVISDVDHMQETFIFKNCTQFLLVFLIMFVRNMKTTQFSMSSQSCTYRIVASRSTSRSVPTDLGNWGPSGPDRTTKILWTGPNGPGPDLPEKECDKMEQKTCQNLTMLNSHVWFVFESLLLSFYKVWIILKS